MNSPQNSCSFDFGCYKHAARKAAFDSISISPLHLPNQKIAERNWDACTSTSPAIMKGIEKVIENNFQNS